MKKFLLILLSILVVPFVLKGNKDRYPQPFDELNNNHNSPAISTGYYFTDNNEVVPDKLKSKQKFRNIDDKTTGTWYRIYSGPRQVNKNYWSNNPQLGLAFFRNPSLPIENKGDFFATGVAFGTDSTDDAIAGPIPFNMNKSFYFNGIRYDSIYISTNGIIALTNRRYYYDVNGQRTIPQGQTLAYDRNSSDYLLDSVRNYLGSDKRAKVGNGISDLSRDDFGYVYSVLGGEADNPSYNQQSDWDLLAPNTLGGIRARGGDINSGAIFNVNHKAALIAPMFSDMMLSQWNPKTKKAEDYGQVYYNISEDKELFTIYVKNSQAVRNWTDINGTNLNINSNLREDDKNYFSIDYQVQFNALDSSITIIYNNIKGSFKSGYKTYSANEIFRQNGTVGVRGFARHNNYNRLAIGEEEYEQFSIYSNKLKVSTNSTKSININFPDNEYSIKFKQWKNLLRVVDLRFRVRKLIKNSDKEFTEIIPSNKIKDFELLAGDQQLGAIQPVALFQNLANDIQGIEGTNYNEQDLSFQVRFRIINDATGRIIYNRLISVDNTCLSLVDLPKSNRENCSGDPEVKVRLANVSFTNNTFITTYPKYPIYNSYNNKEQNGVPVYKFVEVTFPNFEPNEFAKDHNDKLINIGRLSVSVNAVPSRPGAVKLYEDWSLDDTLKTKMNVLRRLETLNEDFSTFNLINGKAIPDETKWINKEGNIVDGNEVSRHPLPPRITFKADNNAQYSLNSPALLLNRKKLDGSDWSDGQTDLNGDELISFPIDMRGRKGAALSISVQRTKNQVSFDREYGDGMLIGPEPRSLLNNNQFTPFAVIQSASYVSDALTVEFALPSDDGLNNIINIPENRWRIHPRRRGASPETRQPALEIFGAGGYRVGFLETDKDSALAPENPALGLINGLRANIYDDGIDFEYKKYFIQIPDTFINYRNEGAKNFRFRIKVRASNDQKSNFQISDDDDDFIIDNVKILYRSIETTDIEVSAIKIIWPYTLAPASQATNIPIRVTLSNNTINSSGSYIVKVIIFKDYKPGDERNRNKKPVYCCLETVNTHEKLTEMVISMRPFEARRAGGGKFRIFGIVMVPNGDLDDNNDTTYTDIDIKFGDSFAYDNIENPKNDVSSFGKGLNLKGYAYGGVGSTNGDWSNYSAITHGQGEVGGSASGQIAMKFNLLSADTVYGYKAYFGSQNIEPNEISFSLYTDQADKPNILVAGSTILRYRGRDAIRSKQPEDLFWNEYVDYRLNRGVRLQPGTYWMSIAQLGQTGMELGASKSRMGIRTTNVSIPSPFTNVLVGNKGTHLMIHKEFRKLHNKDKNLINNNVFAYENTKGVGNWNEFMPSSGNPAYAHNHHFGVSNVDNQTLTLTRSTWIPMIRPFLGNKKVNQEPIYYDCGDWGWSWGGCYIPVELTAFSANVRNKGVDLFWETASEINNAGFYVEKREIIDTNETKLDYSDWKSIKFVDGAGNTNNTQYYSTIDLDVINKRKYQYRLVQQDFDGTQDTSNEVTIYFDNNLSNSEMLSINNIKLEQNFPNPMTDKTTFEFTILESQKVKLEVMDLFGNLVATIVDGQLEAGSHSQNWNGTDFNGNQLSNGTYLYRLTAGEKSVTAKLTMVK